MHRYPKGVGSIPVGRKAAITGYKLKLTVLVKNEKSGEVNDSEETLIILETLKTR